MWRHRRKVHGLNSSVSWPSDEGATALPGPAGTRPRFLGPLSMAKVYLNGQIVPAEEARILALDAGLLLGAGLFETLRAYDRFVFRLGEHLDRLLASAKALDIPLRQSRDELADAVARTIEANELRDARCRITVTRGPIAPERPAAAAGDERTARGRKSAARPAETADQPQATCLITAGEMTPYPPELYERGMTVTVSEVRANATDPLLQHKTTSYLGNLTILRDAHSRGAQEALRLNGPGHLAEGCISNAFLVLHGRLSTPPPSEGCLPGVTRKVVLELARAAGLEAAEEPIPAADVLQAHEIFLTNTIMEVMPVCRIERHPLADDRPGEITRRLMALYKEQVEKERS